MNWQPRTFQPCTCQHRCRCILRLAFHWCKIPHPTFRSRRRHRWSRSSGEKPRRGHPCPQRACGRGDRKPPAGSRTCDERSKERDEERSDEWKVVSYAGRRYVVLLSLCPSRPSLLVQSHLHWSKFHWKPLLLSERPCQTRPSVASMYSALLEAVVYTASLES